MDGIRPPCFRDLLGYACTTALPIWAVTCGSSMRWALPDLFNMGAIRPPFIPVLLGSACTTALPTWDGPGGSSMSWALPTPFKMDGIRPPCLRLLLRSTWIVALESWTMRGELSDAIGFSLRVSLRRALLWAVAAFSWLLLNHFIVYLVSAWGLRSEMSSACSLQSRRAPPSMPMPLGGLWLGLRWCFRYVLRPESSYELYSDGMIP